MSSTRWISRLALAFLIAGRLPCQATPAGEPDQSSAPIILRAPSEVSFGTPFTIEVVSEAMGQAPTWPDGIEARLESLTELERTITRRYTATAWRPGTVQLAAGHALTVTSSLERGGVGGSAELPALPPVGTLGWRDAGLPLAVLAAAAAAFLWRRTRQHGLAPSTTSAPEQPPIERLSERLTELASRDLDSESARRRVLVDLDELLRGILQMRFGDASLAAATVTELRAALEESSIDDADDLRTRVTNRLSAHRDLLFTGSAPQVQPLQADLETARTMLESSKAREVAP